MTCSNCGAVWPAEDIYCSNCGRPLYPEASPVPAKKTSHRVPVLIMLIMVIVGSLVFFNIRLAAPEPSVSSEAPWFTIEGNVLVSFHPEAYSGPSDLVIPPVIDGVQVLSVGTNCFYGCSGLTSITLPEGLTSIGSGAFSGCADLRGMYFPASIQSIGEYAFYRCSALESICINSTIESIGMHAFEECNALVYILFSGTKDQWHGLYSEYINPFTYVFSSTGTFPQGGKPNS